MLLTSRDLDWFFRPLHGTGKVARYPLTNLGIDKDETLHIDVAIAGFQKEDISIELKGNELHLIGVKTDVQNEDVEYIQQHISSNDFTRVIALHENYVNGDISASINNGILSVRVKSKEPAKKLIEIK